MEEVHQYEIKLRKDDLLIDLSSDDVYFISKQMDKWFRILLDDSYIPVNLPPWPGHVLNGGPSPAAQAPAPSVSTVSPEQVAYTPPPATPASVPEPDFIPRPADEAAGPLHEMPVSVALPETLPSPVLGSEPAELPIGPTGMTDPATGTPPVLPTEVPPEPAPQPVAAVAPPEPPVLAPAPTVRAADPTRVAPIPLPPSPAPVVAPVPAPDDFEAVMDSVMKDLEIAPEQDEILEALSEHSPDLVVETLTESEPEPPAVPEVKTPPAVSNLSDLIDLSNAESIDDYMILTAYFLNRYEQLPVFSLKRVNSTMVKAGLSPANHSVLEVVLMQGNIAMVPDMTGTAEASQYTLTPQGESRALQML